MILTRNDGAANCRGGLGVSEPYKVVNGCPMCGGRTLLVMRGFSPSGYPQIQALCAENCCQAYRCNHWAVRVFGPDCSRECGRWRISMSFSAPIDVTDIVEEYRDKCDNKAR